jgi:hypothetical protein
VRQPAGQINYAMHPQPPPNRLTKRLTTFLSLVFTDTFQALIQYPDVVTAQAAKLVSLFSTPLLGTHENYATRSPKFK